MASLVTLVSKWKEKTNNKFDLFLLKVKRKIYGEKENPSPSEVRLEDYIFSRIEYLEAHSTFIRDAALLRVGSYTNENFLSNLVKGEEQSDTMFREHYLSILKRVEPGAVARYEDARQEFYDALHSLYPNWPKLT